MTGQPGVAPARRVTSARPRRQARHALVLTLSLARGGGAPERSSQRATSSVSVVERIIRRASASGSSRSELKVFFTPQAARYPSARTSRLTPGLEYPLG